MPLLCSSRLFETRTDLARQVADVRTALDELKQLIDEQGDRIATLQTALDALARVMRERGTTLDAVSRQRLS